MSRALRRHHDTRIKARVIAHWTLIKGNIEQTDREVGRLASTHMRPCSCSLCAKEPRRAPRFKEDYAE